MFIELIFPNWCNRPSWYYVQTHSTIWAVFKNSLLYCVCDETLLRERLWNRAYFCGEDILRGVLSIIVIAECQILCLIVWSQDLKMVQLMLDLVYFVFSLDDILVVVRAQLGCLWWWRRSSACRRHLQLPRGAEMFACDLRRAAAGRKNRAIICTTNVAVHSLVWPE